MTDRLRVGLDLTPLIGNRTGIGVFAAELAIELARADRFDLVAFGMTWRGRGELVQLAPKGFRVVTRPWPARPSRELWLRSEVPPVELFTGGLDVVHGTNFVVPPARRAARIVTVHDLTPKRFPELCAPTTLAYGPLVERAWRRGAWIHTDSHFVAEEVREWLAVREVDAHRVVPIHLGVRPPQEDGDAAAGRALAGANRYVLAVGTIEPRKGLVHLVDAFDAVVAADDPGRDPQERVSLVIAGPDGWGVDQFEAAVQRCGARARIRRLGWVTDEQRADLLAGAALLAYPSIYEGFGLPPLEAMGRGVPVVCSDAGPLPEVVGDAAVLSPVGDAAGLAEAIVAVLTDDDRRAALAERGRAHAATFRWDRCADALSALYERCAASRTRT